jgi:CRP-like cAMP-binding protein
MIPAEELEVMARVPIFAALPPTALRRLGDLARHVEVEGPTSIFVEGESASEMVIVLRGELEVRKCGRGGHDARIATLKSGDVAGEMSLIDIQPRSASVRAMGPATLLVITHADLAALYREDLESYTILVLNIAREISRRLRRADSILADILIDVQDVWTDAMKMTGAGAKSLP